MARIAILSDSHDNLDALAKALEQVRASRATLLLHCGDLCAPFVLDRLGKGFSGPIHVVFGNNDADGRMLQVVANKHTQIALHGIYAEIAVPGSGAGEGEERTIAMIHYPEPARRIAASGQVDVVCYGHNHQKHAEQVGSCWLVNPGELLGLVGAPTWGLYDSDAHTFEHQLLNA